MSSKDHQSNIPHSELYEVLVEFYGKKSAINILEKIKKGKVTKKCFEYLTLTKYEKQFLSLITEWSSYDNHSNYIYTLLEKGIKKELS